MPKVSIIIPAYNAEKYAAETLNSVRGQSFTGWEAIIIDDGSSDKTAEIIKPYLADERFSYTKQANQGPAAARNTGLMKAQGELVAFIDADDLWENEKLEKQIPLFDKHNTVFTFTNARFFGPGTRDFKNKNVYDDFTPPRGKIFRQLLFSNIGSFITTSTVMVRRSVLRPLRFFDNRYITCEDYHAWMRIARDHNVDYLMEPLTRYRVYNASISSNVERHLLNHLGSRKDIVKKYKIKPRNAKEHKSLYLDYKKIGRYYLSVGQLKKARRYLNKYLAAVNSDKEARKWYRAAYIPKIILKLVKRLK